MIAACVVSLSERHELLAEAIASVYGQHRQPDDVVVGIDYSRRGEVWNNNRLLDATDADWVGFLHDDDIWLPSHLEVAERFFDHADVIVSRFELVGRSPATIEPQHENFADLRFTNWFPPSAVVVRREVFDHWTDPERTPPRDWVDWSNWRRLYEAGARFVHTNVVTMQYRFFGDNGSWRG